MCACEREREKVDSMQTCSLLSRQRRRSFLNIALDCRMQSMMHVKTDGRKKPWNFDISQLQENVRMYLEEVSHFSGILARVPLR